MTPTATTENAAPAATTAIPAFELIAVNLANFLTELTAVDLTAPLKGPMKPMAPTDVLVGVLSDDLKRVVHLVDSKVDDVIQNVRTLRAQIVYIRDEHQRLHEENERDAAIALDCLAHWEQAAKLERQIKQQMAISKALANVSWGLIAAAHPGLVDQLDGAHSKLEIREGFNLVLAEDEHAPMMGGLADLVALIGAAGGQFRAAPGDSLDDGFGPILALDELFGDRPAPPMRRRRRAPLRDRES